MRWSRPALAYLTLAVAGIALAILIRSRVGGHRLPHRIETVRDVGVMQIELAELRINHGALPEARARDP